MNSELIREALEEQATRAPSVSHESILTRVRRHRRRRAAGAAALVAVAVVGIVITVSGAVGGRVAQSPASGGGEAILAAVPPDYLPTWLPPRLSVWGATSDDGFQNIGPGRTITWAPTGTKSIASQTLTLGDDNSGPSGGDDEAIQVNGVRGTYSTFNLRPYQTLQAIEWPGPGGRRLTLTDVGLGLSRAVLLRVAESVRAQPARPVPVPVRVAQLPGQFEGLQINGPERTVELGTGGTTSYVQVSVGNRPQAPAARPHSPVVVGGRPGYTVTNTAGDSEWVVVPLRPGVEVTVQVPAKDRQPLPAHDPVAIAAGVTVDLTWPGWAT